MSRLDAPDRLTPVTALPLAACFEFVMYSGKPSEVATAGAWPAAPGQASQDAAGRLTMLHFAPDRWLVPAPAPELLQELASLERGGCGMLVEVEGKWQQVQLAAKHSRRILSSSIDVEVVLAGRQCAAVMLFDSPGIVARNGESFDVWMVASFVESFIAVAALLPDLQPSS
jgi:sarcosine oxidase gamma subunit